MTGEVTLRGRVLAIGGLREKTMAAYRAGVKTVLIPEENIPDLEEVDPVVKKAITFIPAKEVETVLETALARPIDVSVKDNNFIDEISILGLEHEPKTVNIQ